MTFANPYRQIVFALRSQALCPTAYLSGRSHLAQLEETSVGSAWRLVLHDRETCSSVGCHLLADLRTMAGSREVTEIAVRDVRCLSGLFLC